MAQADKLERLMNLLATLLETPTLLSADHIRKRVPGYPDDLGAFRRAFERDKDDLREMGVPVERAEIPGTHPPIPGYRVRPDRYYLRDPALDPDELAALHLALEAVRFDGIEGGGALWKLGGRPGELSPPPSEVAELPADANLVSLFSAVGEHRSARFAYRSPKGVTERTIDPYRLDFQRGRWYVTGFDHDRGGERHFRLDRVQGEVRLGPAGGFTLPSTIVPGVRLAPWELGEGAPVTARVLVDAAQAALARTMVGPDVEVEERPDGSVVVALPVTSPDGLRSFVLGFLDHAEVLDPPERRDEIVAWLEQVVASAEAAPR
jgi:predicted DNA-binding transcriptional regulator YafY